MLVWRMKLAKGASIQLARDVRTARDDLRGEQELNWAQVRAEGIFACYNSGDE